MSRAAAIARAHTYFDSGEFLVDLRRRVAIPGSSQEPERAPALRRYLEDEMMPSLARLRLAHSGQSIGSSISGGRAQGGARRVHAADLRARRHSARPR